MFTRVCSGILGGRRIKVCHQGVRPTQNRVKQALFSMLTNRLDGSFFLDLYAGSGSIGIEAWSRGAKHVSFVEKDKKVANILKQNVAMCKNGISVYVMDCLKFLRKNIGDYRYNIIFADPPYEEWEKGTNNYLDIILSLILNGTVLAQNGIVVLEKSTASCVVIPLGWELIDRRQYGETELLFLRTEGLK